MRAVSICGAAWDKWTYVPSPVTWGFNTNTTTLIGRFAAEPREGESGWLGKVQPTRSPLQVPPLGGQIRRMTQRLPHRMSSFYRPDASITKFHSYFSQSLNSRGTGGDGCTQELRNFNSNILIMLLFQKCVIIWYGSPPPSIFFNSGRTS